MRDRRRVIVLAAAGLLPLAAIVSLRIAGIDSDVAVILLVAVACAALSIAVIRQWRLTVELAGRPDIPWEPA